MHANITNSWKSVLLRKDVTNRFRQLKEDERKKKLSKALPAEEVQTSGLTYDSDAGSDEENNDKVKCNLWWLFKLNLHDYFLIKFWFLLLKIYASVYLHVLFYITYMCVYISMSIYN